MSDNSNYYYYPATGTTSGYATPTADQSWPTWPQENQQYYTNSYGNKGNNYPGYPQSHNHQQGSSAAVVPNKFYNNNSNNNNNGTSRPSSFQNNRRFRRPITSYPPPPIYPNWTAQRNNNYNPRRFDPAVAGNAIEPKSKTIKKKKKPLSQNVPNKKDWTMEEADVALSVERDYNRRNKNHSLIIKFPDLELNKDIVAKFHPNIENVHFQQPSTPRFCFVTLEESADADQVISVLNQTKFGNGVLTAEYKKDREDDLQVSPEDIDPLTLYVGNLAQDVTKDDMVKAYPRNRRIDIGYAKKMKYTRYAFVAFKTIQDSVEAFKKTHSTQMYSKSLIVRFRRLHGPVGMPGESKQQTSPGKNRTVDEHVDVNNHVDRINGQDATQQVVENHVEDAATLTTTCHSLDPARAVDSTRNNDNDNHHKTCNGKNDDVSTTTTTTTTVDDVAVDLSKVKPEPIDENMEEFDVKPIVKTEFPPITNYMPTFVMKVPEHRPIPEVEEKKPYLEDFQYHSEEDYFGDDDVTTDTDTCSSRVGEETLLADVKCEVNDATGKNVDDTGIEDNDMFTEMDFNFT